MRPFNFRRSDNHPDAPSGTRPDLVPIVSTILHHSNNNNFHLHHLDSTILFARQCVDVRQLYGTVVVVEQHDVHAGPQRSERCHCSRHVAGPRVVVATGPTVRRCLSTIAKPWDATRNVPIVARVAIARGAPVRRRAVRNAPEGSKDGRSKVQVSQVRFATHDGRVANGIAPRVGSDTAAAAATIPTTTTAASAEESNTPTRTRTSLDQQQP
mmetsp:Transcript_1574/g.4301  ORF Transcript_1574/g.4301 Transcript_1574/m.4301 type:complete len:212 (+) Transcript_1574:264-899(+)